MFVNLKINPSVYTYKHIYIYIYSLKKIVIVNNCSQNILTLKDSYKAYNQ